MLTLSVKPSSVFANSKVNTGVALEDLLIIVNTGIADGKSNIAIQEDILRRRRWAVGFAEDYLRQLESKDAGWGDYTTEIVDGEQRILPAMRRKVTNAETRVKHADGLLTQFELLHRLLNSTLARLSPDISDKETIKMVWGMRLFDTEWKKMHEEIVTASQFAGQDNSFYVYFNYRWELVRPDGTTSEVMQSNAMEGPIQLREEDAACEMVLLIGGSAMIRRLVDTQQAQASTAESSTTAEDSAVDADTESIPAANGKERRNRRKKNKAEAKAKAKNDAKCPIVCVVSVSGDSGENTDSSS
jgi:hypothetical protein